MMDVQEQKPPSRPVPKRAALEPAISAFKDGRFADVEVLCSEMISGHPESGDAYFLLAVAQSALGKFRQALENYDRVLSLRPDHVAALNNRGVTFRGMGIADQALADFDRLVTLLPDNAEAHNNRGTALHDLGRYDQALACYDRALALRPDYADALSNRGVTLHELRRFEEALANFQQSLSLQTKNARCWYNQANTHMEMARFEEALTSYDRAIELSQSADAEIFSHHGMALQKLGRFDEALESYDRAVAAQTANPVIHNGRGIVLHELGRYDAALRCFDDALALKPDYCEALSNRGVTLFALKRYDEALADYEAAIRVGPNQAEAFNNRGNIFFELKRYDEALMSFDHALSIRPDYVEALNSSALVLHELNRYEEALARHRRVLEVAPEHRFAFGQMANCALKVCDWACWQRVSEEMAMHIRGQSIVPPFVLLGYSDDPAMQLECAQNFVNRVPQPTPLSDRRLHHDKIRVAYLSPDFRYHAGAQLIAGLIEAHDRSRFEIIGISFGPDDESQMRRRLAAGFDAFHDVRTSSDEEVAQLVYRLEVDIAVDRNGHTRYSRPGILAHRPAPIQATYLGYPGTTGAPYIDYIIADATVAPFEHQPFFSERIIQLPECYQANDNKRKISEHTPTRRDVGLPDTGFVFCSFNNSWKITPFVFDVWMRLLSRVDGSVLWLLRDSETAERNLRQEAAKRGVDPSRLVFAPRIWIDDHLARHRLADLFLDTLPYNAHTTASDSLWTGLPIITCVGHAFAARVATSLLRNIGLPELITERLSDYEALAFRLATDPTLLHHVGAKLRQHRDTQPLFDTPRIARHIESAFETMYEIWQRGEPPRSFAVRPLEAI